MAKRKLDDVPGVFEACEVDAELLARFTSHLPDDKITETLAIIAFAACEARTEQRAIIELGDAKNWPDAFTRVRAAQQVLDCCRELIESMSAAAASPQRGSEECERIAIAGYELGVAITELRAKRADGAARKGRKLDAATRKGNAAKRAEASVRYAEIKRRWEDRDRGAAIGEVCNRIAAEMTAAGDWGDVSARTVRRAVTRK